MLSRLSRLLIEVGEPWLLINLVVTSFSWMVTKTVLGDEPLVCSLKEAPLKVTPEPMADECPTCKKNIILISKYCDNQMSEKNKNEA